MRASNDGFYNLKRLHAVFALSALALLATTVWMVAADHWREWKRYQRAFRDRIEPWMNEAAIREQESGEPSARHKEPASASNRPGPSVGREFRRLPFVDALGRSLSIEQVWLPDLAIHDNFRRVARFDRCATCHQGIDQTAAGSAEPAYRREEMLKVQLATPAERPKTEAGQGGEGLKHIYGFSLADRGILNPQDVTIGLVLPKTPAALAGLYAGDTILAIDGSPVASVSDVEQHLLHDATWGKPAELEIRRGLPHPYASHPRLDLFVGAQSPHPMPEFGCTVCHEGQGSATEFTFASHTPNDPAQRSRWRREHGWFWNRDWDLAMRPKRFAESGCLKCHHEVSDLEPSARFPDPPAPKLLAGYHLVRKLGCFGCHEIRGVTDTGERTGPDMRLEPNGEQGAETARPGTMRRVGPGLRDVAGKLDAAFLQSWLVRPSDFRPATRMPQFFGLHEHLNGKELDEARRFEPVEIRAVIEYLLAASQTVAPLGSPPDATEPPSIERGKRLFQTQGCLACHKHLDFPEGQSIQGPDLSRIGAKLATPAGAKWLASWLRDPARHSPRTLMPNPLLEPVTIRAKNGEGNGEGNSIEKSERKAKPQAADAVADIVAYLLTGKDWRPRELPELVEPDLDELALLHLSKTFPRETAQKYLRDGIPASVAGQVPGDATELVGPMTTEKKVRYVGRRTIRKRGCFGCHDIAGFEDATPIGPPLSDWGRKQESLLAFEQVHQFVLEGKKTAASETQDPPDDAFYLEALLSKRREGFLWQKLRDPRSFDYQRTDRKGYNEHLLMGRFTLTDAEREAISTFVLGLVAEPAKGKYLFQPDRRQRAIIEGRKVLDQYGCAQCHTLEMERWTIDVDAAKFPAPPTVAEYPFLKPQVTPKQLAASQAPNRRGMVRAELVGMPQWNAEGKPEETEDEDGSPVQSFTLWEPAVIAGKVWPVGGAGVLVAPKQIIRKRAALGGDFARLLYPVALAQAKEAGSTATVVEAWGWVPPALVHEGQTVQPAWLYDYLLEPTVIRPAAVLRMPKYNLSPLETGKLVDYFAAVSGAEFPYMSDPRGRAARLNTRQQTESTRLEKALRLVIDRTTYCAKCHLIGDAGPGGDNRTVLAPNLERVGRRIRPKYLRRWLANPKSVLPYTAMPVNFPPDQATGQEIFPGTSLEQLDGVMDLLLNYDGYMKRRVSILELMGK